MRMLMRMNNFTSQSHSGKVMSLLNDNFYEYCTNHYEVSLGVKKLLLKVLNMVNIVLILGNLVLQLWEILSCNFRESSLLSQ